MNTTPLVSIITPCYNTQKYIAKTIESVLSQTYENWEMIIVDDASADGSREIVNQYALKNPRIRLIENVENRGVAESRNVAIAEAKGRYIAFLDSDDVWMPQKLEKQIALMEQEGVALCYSAYETIDDNGNKLAYHPVKISISYRDLLKKPSIVGTLTMIYDANKLGKFYFNKTGHEDYIVKLDILKQIGIAKGIDIPLAKYRILNSSLSSNKIQAAKWVWDIYRKVEKLSLMKSIYYFLHYAYYSITKYKKI